MSATIKLILVALVSFLLGITSATAGLGRYQYEIGDYSIIRVDRFTQEVCYWKHSSATKVWQCPR